MGSRNLSFLALIPLLLFVPGCFEWAGSDDMTYIRQTIDDIYDTVDEWEEIAAAEAEDPCEAAKLQETTAEVKKRLAQISNVLADVSAVDPNESAEAILDATISVVKGLVGEGIPYLGVVLAGLLGLRIVLRSKKRKDPPDPGSPEVDIE